MGEWHEHLTRPKPLLTNVVLHDGVAARETVLVPEAVEDALRSVPLLAVAGPIVFQDPIDDSRERTQLWPPRRRASAIPWRHRERQHLTDRLAVYTKHPRGLAGAHPLDMTRPPNPCVQLHPIHPPRLPVRATLTEGYTRSHFGPPQPDRPAASVGDYCSAVLSSGREKLCRTLFGAEEADGGEILLDGQPAHFGGCADAVQAGIGYVPAERRTEGIIGGLSVKENITLAHIDEVLQGAIVDHKLEKEIASNWIDRLRIKTPSAETPTINLSGGNQQKVVLSKWLMSRTLKILILDHPMRGLDVGAKAEIFALTRELAESGIGIVLIADTLDELIALSGTIIVMRDGVISQRFTVSENSPTRLQILECMI